MLQEVAGRGRENGEVAQLMTNQNVLADLTEALIGALYVTFGYEAVRPAVIQAFTEHIDFAESSYVDHKTELQESLAKTGKSVTYRVVGFSGPPHHREFEIEAAVEGEVLGHGVGTSKKRAEQEAAEEALQELRVRTRRQTRRARLRGRRRTARRGRRCRAERSLGLRSAGDTADAGDAVTRRRRRPGRLSVYLKRLRLRGFKSFPRQTELVFEPGVGVVIGPNGSGKSNLADAVVWALGEQSASSLRGSSMQDVIFAGSDGRRASAQAEVELTFDNADGALPLPTDEVGVMRRVARDGSSQYFINQSSCRLTDVVELMAGVGLGKELHSIIGQGRVESFLAGKPEDRRSQIEEAAGLGTYKRRRERAELKLREVRRNLERAELLEREVGAQLGPLRRQATAAEQLRAAESELAEVRGRLLAGELAEADAGLRAGRAELAELEAERARCDEALQGLADERAGEEERFARRLAERERRARRLLRVRVLDGRLEAAERLAAQRLRLLEELERSGGAERERLLAELAGAPEPEEAGAESGQAEARLAAELEAAEASHAEVVGRLEGARAAVAERRAEATRLAVEREGDLARAARLQRRREALRGRGAASEAAARGAAGRSGRAPGIRGGRGRGRA